jgi:HK97 family phage prohead protease
MRGAFADTLAARGLRRIPMLFQHDPSEPVGIWLELREDHRGLFARGRLIPDVMRGRELLSLLRAGAIDGLSIGFRTAKARIDPRTQIRRIYAVDLWEISIVTFPMLTRARVRSVKRAPHARPRTDGQSVRRPLKSSEEPEVFHDALLMMLAHCIDVGNARVVFLRSCRHAPLFAERAAFQGHFGISLVFQRGPGSGRGVSVPPDEGEQSENADGQHFP